MVCLLCDFKILLTVFNQSCNCQTSHYLGRNRLPKPFLILPSLVFKVAEVPKVHKDKDKYIDKWKLRLIWRLDSGLGRRSCSTGFGIEVIPWRMPFPLLPVVLGWLTRLLYCTTKALERFQVFWNLHNIYIFSIGTCKRYWCLSMIEFLLFNHFFIRIGL